ncbi:MAG: transporter substrate-binding domain-containing protein [Actinobacteria bacterium]|nr:transporter substrate-binding domain-containing protein [Actinomycetota bacterium]MCG2807699.1 transporter substrate-binding domain-containing protein [Coriobacteriia bacterium]
MRGFMRFTTAIVLVFALAAMAACTPAAPETVMEPKIAPPAIATAGVLVAGVDFEVPPYAGKDDGRQAGLDIDVAAALAEQLGLSLETVQVAPSQAATALADGTADIVLSMPIDEASVLGATIVGTYVSSGPAFFVASGDASGSPEASASAQTSDGTDPVVPAELLTLGSLGSLRIGAQQGSASFWLLEYELGESAVEAYPTIRAAFDALAAGQIDVVASDALVGAYIARDFTGVRFAGQPTQAKLLGIGAAVDNTELAETVRVALDKLAADGVLDAIRAKWVGELPVLETLEGSLSIDASTTP